VTTSVSGETRCTGCDEIVLPGEAFCEACGRSLSVDPDEPGCPGCGASSYDTNADGYCTRCGTRWSPVRAHDEHAEGPIAAVTDRGRHHWRNEDAVGIRWIDGYPHGFAMVVCDGVSVSQDPHLVSQAAVDNALLVLSTAIATGGALDRAVTEATAAAQRAAAAVPFDPTLTVGPGACTIVAVALRGNEAAFASVGDSRAYWVDETGATQIGTDDSLAGALVASGRFTVEQAMANPGAHALTKWLGIDSTDAAPTVTNVELLGPGVVVLASDGLWNYAPDIDDLARLVGPIEAVAAAGPLDLARRLADFADRSGGADNITVAVGLHDLGPDAIDRERTDPMGHVGHLGRRDDR
jgi:serine/threonine protein phosphatase PrpC